MWTKKGKGTRRRPVGRLSTTERQDNRFRQPALGDHFAITRQIDDQWIGEEGRPVNMRTLYQRIRTFELYSYHPRHD